MQTIREPAGEGPVFLRPEVVVEPLVCGWYAWTHLVSPAQHAMNVVFRHLPLLTSFVQFPSVHTEAAAQPELFGGPFVDLPDTCVPAVRDLLDDTRSRCAGLIEFAEALRRLEIHVLERAKGYSMDDFYTAIPRELAGLVEFVYDLNQQPRVRLYEELLPDLGWQTQELMIGTPRDVERRFFMSTPRLATPDNLITRIPFADSRVDLLAASRTRATPLQDLERAFAVAEERRPTFRSFFTEEPVKRNAPEYAGDGVRLRYFGHACVLIQTARTSILVDPMVAWGNDRGDARLTFADLPDRIDYVVISHNHQDHCVPEVLLQLRHRVGCVIVPRNNSGNPADPSLKLLMQQLGFPVVRVMDPFDTVAIPEGRITSLPFPGEHVDLDIHARHGFHVAIKDRTFAFLVDSDGRDPELFRRITERLGRAVDALFIGMECHGAPLSWLYKPLLAMPISRRNDESRRLSGLNAERAWNVVSQFWADKVFVYAMGQEPWLRFIMGLEYTPDSIQLTEVRKLLERCARAGIPAENLQISKEILFPAEGKGGGTHESVCVSRPGLAEAGHGRAVV